MFILQQRSLALLLILSLTLIGCSQVGPYVEPIEPDALPLGPGVFTGNSGRITIGSNGNDSDTNSISDAKIKAKI